MCESDNSDDKHQGSKDGTSAREPQDDERKEHDEGGLDVIVQGNAGDNNGLGVQKVEVEIGGHGEQTAEEGERGAEDGEGGHDEQDDEVVEGVIFKVLLDAVEEVCKLGLGHLRRVEEFRPRTRTAPDIGHTRFDRFERGEKSGDSGESGRGWRRSGSVGGRGRRGGGSGGLEFGKGGHGGLW